MKKPRKSRVSSVQVQVMSSVSGDYYLVTPFDRKGKEIPSSVQCAFNAVYYEPHEVFQMARAL